MKKLVSRLLTFFIGVPLVVALVLLLPQMNHVAFNIVVTVFCGLGAVEMAWMMEKKGFHIPTAEAAILGIIIPLAETLVTCFGLPNGTLPAGLVAAAFWLLVCGIFDNEEKIKGYMGHAAAGFAALIYPGLFIAWMIRMARWEASGPVILVFLLIVFAADSAAWLFGMLFGKGNRGLIPVSPNKSVAGFIGGLFGSAVIAVAAVLLGVFPSMRDGIIVGLVTSLAAILGDLGESALKRSCDTKDSGFLMMGRGGVLDSLDSIALAAPVFYALFGLLCIK